MRRLARLRRRGLVDERLRRLLAVVAHDRPPPLRRAEQLDELRAVLGRVGGADGQVGRRKLDLLAPVRRVGEGDGEASRRLAEALRDALPAVELGPRDDAVDGDPVPRTQLGDAKVPAARHHHRQPWRPLLLPLDGARVDAGAEEASRRGEDERLPVRHLEAAAERDLAGRGVLVAPHDRRHHHQLVRLEHVTKLAPARHHRPEAKLALARLPALGQQHRRAPQLAG
mmetsp:Transcript_12277/g.40010  ORF Transcript_12277/g.40010 Transcript_12277/m.40010 type:complete len:227 (-) Transcript_12277:187-867(-)